MIHTLSDIKTDNIGEGTDVWQFSVILEKAIIGKHCNINAHVFIENEVVLGDYVTVKSGVQLWDGLSVHDHVFIGPNVTFTNDLNPRSKQYPDQFQRTIIHHHASIGAGAIILGGSDIGAYAMIGAGAVVTKSIPENALMIGNPARIAGWVNKDGSKMSRMEEDFWIDNNGRRWIQKENRLEEA